MTHAAWGGTYSAITCKRLFATNRNNLTIEPTPSDQDPRAAERPSERQSRKTQTTFTQKAPIMHVEGDLPTFLRSNPKWNWQWLTENNSNYFDRFPYLQKAYEFKGIVGGDIKPDNIEITGTKKKKETAITDVDDSGYGSFIFNLLHTLSYNSVWKYRIRTKEAISAYDYGIQDKTLKTKYSLEEILTAFEKYSQLDSHRSGSSNKELSDSKKTKKKNRSSKEESNKKDADEIPVSKKLFYKKLELKDVSESTSLAQELWSKNSDLITGKVSAYGEIIHFGVRVKEYGGSMKLPRYSFYVRTPENTFMIYEVKLLPDYPAVSYGGEKQRASHAERIQEALEYLRPSGDSGAIKEIFSTSDGHEFIFRERKKSPININLVIKYESELLDYYLDFIRHMFWWMGRSDGLQSPEYVQFWKDYELSTKKDDFKEIIHDMIERAMYLHSQSKEQEHSPQN